MSEDPVEAALRVEKGRLIAYRLFDLGDELFLDRAMQRLGALAEFELTRAGARGLSGEPPLDVSFPGERAVGGEASPLALKVSARFFAQGMALVRFEKEIAPGASLDSLRAPYKELAENAALAEEARAVIEGLRPTLGDALVPGSGPAWPGCESYTIVFVEAFAGHPTAEAVMANAPTVAKLLVGELSERPLAAGEVADLTEQTHSYQDDDLVVVRWDGAFVLEPSGGREILDVLELANAVLTGLRAYDTLLEAELEPLFKLAQRRPGAFSVLWSPLGGLSRRIHRRWLELAEFTERWENAIKVVEDHYYARVYRAALERVGVPAWQASVERKQERIAQVHAFLKEGVDTQRMMVLELTIVLLILVEVLLFLGER